MVHKKSTYTLLYVEKNTGLSSRYHTPALKLDPITGEEIITSIFIEKTKEPKELKTKLVSDYFPVMDNILSFSHLPDTYI